MIPLLSWWLPGLLPGLLLLSPRDGIDTEPPAPLAFIHVEANVGGASGGHMALRIGDFVYHFQQTDASLLELIRDDWNGFRGDYAGLQNRSLHIVYLDVAPRDIDRIARRFSLAWVDQQIDLDRVVRRRDDVRWLEALRDGTPLPPLRGAGLLAPTTGCTVDATDLTDATALQDTVAAALGSDFVRDEIGRLDRALAEFELAPDSTDLAPLRELLSLREALHSIDERRPLAKNAIVDELDRAGRTGLLPPRNFAASERPLVAHFIDAQRVTIVALLRSRRPDRALALHVAIARHHVLSRSSRLDRWITLDPFPDDARCAAPPDPDDRLAKRRAAAEAATAADVADQVRATLLVRATHDETSLAALEAVMARRREADRRASGEPMRLHCGRMVPSRGRSVEWPIDRAPCRLDSANLTDRAAAALASWQASFGTIESRCAYSLTGHNCVTELVRLMNSSFRDEDAVVGALGGRLEPGENLAFIPFLLHDQVVANLRITRQETHLSRRLDSLARLGQSAPGLLIALRESMTLSSTLYQPHASDGEFLLFTDDVVLTRPLCGVINLAYATGQGIVGVFTAAFDDGRRLRGALHGAIFSLPELVFGNVRKGTYLEEGAGAEGA